MNKSSTGFTLIELLIVVAIIGLLSGVVLTSVNTVRAKARDAVRKTTLNQMRTALESYRNDNGAYPSTSGAWRSSEPNDYYVDGYAFGGQFVPQYISKLPRDPLGGAAVRCGVPWKRAFLYLSNGTDYNLKSHCAPEGVMSPTDGFYDSNAAAYGWEVCSGPIGCAW